MTVEILEDDCTLEEVVALIRATPVNATQIRPARGNLADMLRAAPADPAFHLESWQCQWYDVEAELKSLARANGVAEGR